MKRVFSLFLCLVMLLSLFPALALATEDGNGGDNQQEQTQQTDPADDPANDGQDDPNQNEGNGPTEGENAADEKQGGQEEAKEPEEPETKQDTPKEDAQPVRVVFICDPKETVITVYDTLIDENGEPTPAVDEDGNFLAILPEEDGAYLLMPGVWLYDAECTGYMGLNEAELTVKVLTEGETEQIPNEIWISLPKSGNSTAKRGMKALQPITVASLSSLSCSSFITNAEHREYIDKAMKYYLTTNSGMIDTLNNGNSVIFMFEGGSDNYPSNSYSSAVRNQAVVIVVNNVNGTPTISFYSEDCSSIPDNPNHTDGSAYNYSTTILDGVYLAYTTNHPGNGGSSYGALNVRDTSGSSAFTGYYTPSNNLNGLYNGCSGINIHTRTSSYKSSDDSWHWSEGCQLIGSGATSTNAFNQFMKAVTGINYNVWTDYYSGSLSTVSSNQFVGYYVCDRQLAISGLSALYSSAAINNITKASSSTSAMASGAGQTIADGDYLIVSARNPSYFLDIEGSAVPAANSTNVSLCGPLNQQPPASDIWTVTYVDEGGFYTIYQKGASVSLDVYMSSTAQGTNIQAYTANGSSGQRWSISETGTGIYRIQAKCSGQSLDITSGNIANLTNIEQWGSNDSNAQKWMFIPYQQDSEIQPTSSFTYNNNLYEIYDYSASWLRAKAICETKGGHLVTITDQGEQNKIVSMLSGCTKNLYYIGLTDAATEGVWKWVTDQAFSFENWDSQAPEPTNGTGENYGAIMGKELAPNKQIGEWIDTTNATTDDFYGVPNCGFICEYESAATYTVSYNANGGTGAPDDQFKTHGEALTLSSAVPTREGFRFLGWASSASTTTAEYQPEDSYTTDAELTLYAVWEQTITPARVSGLGATLTDAMDLKLYVKDVPEGAQFAVTLPARTAKPAVAQVASEAAYAQANESVFLASWDATNSRWVIRIKVFPKWLDSPFSLQVLDGDGAAIPLKGYAYEGVGSSAVEDSHAYSFINYLEIMSIYSGGKFTQLYELLGSYAALMKTW